MALGQAGEWQAATSWHQMANGSTPNAYAACCSGKPQKAVSHAPASTLEHVPAPWHTYPDANGSTAQRKQLPPAGNTKRTTSKLRLKAAQQIHIAIGPEISLYAIVLSTHSRTTGSHSTRGRRLNVDRPGTSCPILPPTLLKLPVTLLTRQPLSIRRLAVRARPNALRHGITRTGRGLIHRLSLAIPALVDRLSSSRKREERDQHEEKSSVDSTHRKSITAGRRKSQ